MIRNRVILAHILNRENVKHNHLVHFERTRHVSSLLLRVTVNNFDLSVTGLSENRRRPRQGSDV